MLPFFFYYLTFPPQLPLVGPMGVSGPQFENSCKVMFCLQLQLHFNSIDRPRRGCINWPDTASLMLKQVSMSEWMCMGKTLAHRLCAHIDVWSIVAYNISGRFSVKLQRPSKLCSEFKRFLQAYLGQRVKITETLSKANNLKVTTPDLYSNQNAIRNRIKARATKQPSSLRSAARCRSESHCPESGQDSPVALRCCAPLEMWLLRATCLRLQLQQRKHAP